MVDVQEAFLALGVSLGLGLLVGLQRERGHPHVAGLRTFALIAVLGTGAAIVSESYGGGRWRRRWEVWRRRWWWEICSCSSVRACLRA